MEKKHLANIEHVHSAIEAALNNQPQKQTNQEFKMYSQMENLQSTIKVFLHEEKLRREKTNNSELNMDDFELT